jgi:hypothetical protein
MTAASLERAGVACHPSAMGRRTATARSLEGAARHRSVRKAIASAEDIASFLLIFNAGIVATTHLTRPMLTQMPAYHS